MPRLAKNINFSYVKAMSEFLNTQCNKKQLGIIFRICLLFICANFNVIEFSFVTTLGREGEGQRV